MFVIEPGDRKHHEIPSLVPLSVSLSLKIKGEHLQKLIKPSALLPSNLHTQSIMPLARQTDIPYPSIPMILIQQIIIEQHIILIAVYVNINCQRFCEYIGFPMIYI